MSDKELYTSEEWQKLKPEIEILDPDGWDRQNFEFSWHQERITEAEYDRRIMMSTVGMAPVMIPATEDFYMTVGDLKKLIKKMPDDAKVYYQRIEDVYFEKHEWSKSSVFKADPEYGDDPPIYDEYTRVYGSNRYKDDTNLYLTAHY